MAEDPTPGESLLPVFAGAVVQSVLLATVDTPSIMRTVLALWSRRDGRVMLGLAAATRREGAVEGKGMEFSTQRAELSLERTDTSITFMPEAPAAIALGNAGSAFGRSEDEAMTTIHE